MTLTFNETTGKLDVQMTAAEALEMQRQTPLGISLQKTIDMTRECHYYESGNVPDVNRIITNASELPSSWERNPDRMGGSFTKEEITDSETWR